MHIRATRAQSDLICAPQPVIAEESPAVQNGGNVRGYQELSAPLASPTTAEQADGQAVFLCIGNAGRERPLLPRSGLVRLALSGIARSAATVFGYQGPCSTQSRHLAAATRSGRLPPVARMCSPWPSRVQPPGASSSAHRS
jgi:hypothetical protein